MSYIGDQISGVLSLESDKTAVIFKGAEISWKQLAAGARAIKQAIDGQGIPVGAGIAIILRNRPRIYAAVLAVMMGDRCVVTLNSMLPEKKVAGDLQSLRPSVVIAAGEDWAREEIRAAAREIGAVGISVGDGVNSAISLEPGFETLGSGPFADPLPGVAVLMLTSGTTGEPKRTPQTYRQLELNFKRSARADPTAADDAPRIRDETLIVHGPFVHISGMYFLLHAASTGRAIYLLERFSLDEWRKAIAYVKPAVAGGPPAVMKMVLDANIPPEEFSSLRAFTCGTAPVSPDMIDEFVKRYGIPVLSTYGATEFAGAICGWSIATFQKYWTTKRGSVGRMHPGIEARTVDRETFEPLPVGEVGLLELRGPVLGDGTNWVRVNDLAKIDSDHFLWIVGRADNAILRGGFKISPDEVVKAIESHPAIREASVVGIPDERLGSVPVAAYVVNPGSDAPSSEDLTAFLREQLTPYQVPAQFMQVSELPRTPSLKVSMPGVKALFVGEETTG